VGSKVNKGYIHTQRRDITHVHGDLRIIHSLSGDLSLLCTLALYCHLFWHWERKADRQRRIDSVLQGPYSF